VKIRFFANEKQRSPISSFISKLSIKDQAIIVSVLDDIQKNNFTAKGCKFRKIEGKLWEIKISTFSGGYRFFYVVIEEDIILILHAFKKKSQKAPLKELKLARKRLKEVL